MKMRNATIAMIVTGLSVTSVLAQHQEQHKDQTAPSVAAIDRTTRKAGAMMSGGMLMGQSETSTMVEQLIKGFAAIQAEKAPAAIKAKLAEHGALLKELQAKVQAQSQMMDVMQHMMVGSTMDGIMLNGKMISGKLVGGATPGGEDRK